VCWFLLMVVARVVLVQVLKDKELGRQQDVLCSYMHVHAQARCEVLFQALKAAGAGRTDSTYPLVCMHVCVHTRAIVQR